MGTLPPSGDPYLDAVRVGPRPPELGGVEFGNGVRLGPEHRHRDSDEVAWHQRRIYRDQTDIGGIDYWSCSACRWVLLGEIGLVEQRRGIGTRVLAHLRTELPGYRWSITAAKSPSIPFWLRIRATYPDEYLYCGTGERPVHCPHVDP
ncbi:MULTISPECIES: hypothetical protein [Actinomycetes]|uniref:hypothetical protein n=1 Tax=Actinomycetes TaxID=1760 RepID=UPI0001DEE9C2|nr:MULTISPECIES: hypothetical protein [Actinomycetes]EFL12555.1 predicted protein [Streptomyces sp. AA4]